MRDADALHNLMKLSGLSRPIDMNCRHGVLLGV
jgi:hypothetical protein